MAAYSPLASAAAGGKNPFGASDPFGLSGNAGRGIGYSGSQLLNPPQNGFGLSGNPDRGIGYPGAGGSSTPVIPLPTTQATTPGAAGAPTPNAGQFQFDLKTDPALQQVNALTGLSDEQANAQALQQRQQMLLQYGDPTLAAAVLGQGDPTAQAAGQNQESQLAMLGRQNHQNQHSFEQQLDPSLAFSGYKVGQEQQLGQQYQDALAQAAAGVQSGLGQVSGNLNAALQQNAMGRSNALEQAYMNQLQLILAGLGGGGGTPPPTPSGQALNQTTGGLPQQVSDVSSPLYGQDNPLFNLAAAQKLGPAAAAAAAAAPKARFY